ncbi:hypothetical protein BH10ACT7_BH10ACT7_32910 [soil metagenome]
MTDTPLTGNQRTIKNTGRLAIWTLGWLVTLAIARFGPTLWGDQPVISWIAIAVNVAVGIGWIVAHARFLRGTDDLQRKIMLDAIAVALGATLVGGCAYAAAGHADLVPSNLDIGFVAVLMAVVYIIGIAVGQLRYR